MRKSIGEPLICSKCRMYLGGCNHPPYTITLTEDSEDKIKKYLCSERCLGFALLEIMDKFL